MSIFVGGGGGGGAPTINLGPVFYVSPNGSDTNTGSEFYPFLTFNGLNSYLITLVTQPSASAPFLIYVLPGYYEEGSNTGVIYPNCDYVGQGGSPVVTIDTSGGNTVYYGPALPLIYSAPSLTGFTGISFNSDVVLDFVAMNSYENALSCNDTFFINNLTYTNNGSDYINEFAISRVAQLLTAQDIHIPDSPGIFGSFISLMEINVVNYSGGMQMFGSNCGNIQVTSSGPSFNFIAIGCFNGETTLNGSGVIYNTDVVSYPSGNNVTLLNGAQIGLLTVSEGLQYIPTNGADWLTQPTNAQNAFDILAAQSINALLPVIVTDDTFANIGNNYIITAHGTVNLFVNGGFTPGTIQVTGVTGGWSLNLFENCLVGNLIASSYINSGNPTDCVTFTYTNTGTDVAIPAVGAQLQVI